jgi:hypothetical protein
VAATDAATCALSRDCAPLWSSHLHNAATLRPCSHTAASTETACVASMQQCGADTYRQAAVHQCCGVQALPCRRASSVRQTVQMAFSTSRTTCPGVWSPEWSTGLQSIPNAQSCAVQLKLVLQCILHAHLPWLPASKTNMTQHGAPTQLHAAPQCQCSKARVVAFRYWACTQ